MRFYDSEKIRSKDCLYNISFGQKSNGKTYDIIKKTAEIFWKTRRPSVYLRRWREDMRQGRAAIFCNTFVQNDEVYRITQGIYDKIVYKQSAWYFARYDEELDRDIVDDLPFLYFKCITEVEHDQSSGGITNLAEIHFDEFISRMGYLDDEFNRFLVCVSNFIRCNPDVKIFLHGNTINKYNPYFDGFNLKNIQKMTPGQIDVYTYDNADLTVAVEYTEVAEETEKTRKFFSFSHPKSKMITDGAWETAIYPPAPEKINKEHIIFTYFIIFDGSIVQCDIVVHDSITYTYIHRKTTPIQYPDKDIIFSMDFDPRPNYFRQLTRPRNEICKFIASYYAKGKIFYQDNDTGEFVRNFILQSENSKFI